MRDRGQPATGERENSGWLLTDGSGRCPGAAPLATMRSLAGPARTRALSGRRSVLATGRRRWDPGSAAGAGARKASAETARENASVARAVSSRGEHDDSIGRHNGRHGSLAPHRCRGENFATRPPFLSGNARFGEIRII